VSGHSKWSNIKRRKEAQDQKRGKVFGKLSRLITVAVKQGGSSDPGLNPGLKLAVDRAKVENMPKKNIQRAIENADKKKESIQEFVLEGYGPSGIAILLEVLTDNRQRTIQEIKNIFRSNGGSLTEPGAVAFQFEKKGQVRVSGSGNEEQILKLIDVGAEDIEEEGKLLIVWLKPINLDNFINQAEKLGFKVKGMDLVMKPKIEVRINDINEAKKLLEFLETIEEHDDIQRVFANLDIPESILQRLADE